MITIEDLKNNIEDDFLPQIVDAGYEVFEFKVYFADKKKNIRIYIDYLGRWN